MFVLIDQTDKKNQAHVFSQTELSSSRRRKEGEDVCDTCSVKVPSCLRYPFSVFI